MVIVSSLSRHKDALAKYYVSLTQMSKVQDNLEPMVFIIFGRRCLQEAFFMSEDWQPRLQINRGCHYYKRLIFKTGRGRSHQIRYTFRFL